MAHNYYEEKISRPQMKVHEGMINMWMAMLYTRGVPAVALEVTKVCLNAIHVYLASDCNDALLPSRVLAGIADGSASESSYAPFISMLKIVGW